MLAYKMFRFAAISDFTVDYRWLGALEGVRGYSETRYALDIGTTGERAALFGGNGPVAAAGTGSSASAGCTGSSHRVAGRCGRSCRRRASDVRRDRGRGATSATRLLARCSHNGNAYVPGNRPRLECWRSGAREDASQARALGSLALRIRGESTVTSTRFRASARTQLHPLLRDAP